MNSRAQQCHCPEGVERVLGVVLFRNQRRKFSHKIVGSDCYGESEPDWIIFFCCSCCCQTALARNQ